MATSAVYRLRCDNFDAESRKTDISPFGGGQQPDRGNPQILENLRAKTNFAPLARAGGVGSGVTFMRDIRDRNPRRAVPQIDDDAASRLLESRKRCMDRFGAAKDVTDHVGTMQSRRDVCP